MKRLQHEYNPGSIPFILCFLGLFGVFVGIISERMGTFPSYSDGPFSAPELTGILYPALNLIVPIFAKKLRIYFWTRRNIVASLVVLVVSTILVTVFYANKDYYWQYWFLEPWNKDNCPPVRWDVWNII